MKIKDLMFRIQDLFDAELQTKSPKPEHSEVMEAYRASIAQALAETFGPAHREA